MLWIILLLCIAKNTLALRKVGIVIGPKWDSDTYAIAHHAFFMYDSLRLSQQWTPVFLMQTKNTTSSFTKFGRIYNRQRAWNFTGVDVVIEAGGSYPGNPHHQAKHNFKLIHFNQGPFYFESLKNFEKNEEMATHFTHRRDAIWVTPQYDWQAPYLSEWTRTDNWEVAPYVWRPARLKDAPAYVKGTADRVGVYETNRGVYKMSMIPIMIGNRLHRRHNHSIKYFETPAMRNMYTNEFKSFIENLELDIQAQKDLIHTPKHWSEKNIGTILSHQMTCGLNYLYLEALYLNMSLVHNSEFIQDCGYYYPNFDIEKGAQSLHKAIELHDTNIDSYAQRSAKCLWRYAPENPDNIKRYENLLNKLFF